MIVRAARTPDIPELVVLARAFHAESRCAHIPFDAARVVGYFERFIADPRNALFLIAERDGDLSGFFIAALQPVIFNATLAAAQHLLFVRPDARGGTAASRFVRAYVEWARERDVLFADFPETAGIADIRPLAARFGFEETGTIYRRWAPV